MMVKEAGLAETRQTEKHTEVNRRRKRNVTCGGNPFSGCDVPLKIIPVISHERENVLEPRDTLTIEEMIVF